MKVVASCGYGDKILIADGNYPLNSCTNENTTKNFSCAGTGFTANQIDYRSILFDPEASTGIGNIVIDSTGNNRIIVVPGERLGKPFKVWPWILILM